MRMILRRIAFYVITAIVAITVNFFIPRLMPGNPALAVIGRIQATESKQAIAALEQQYGVQTRTGLWGQYLQYWAHLLHGNLGTSLNFYPASVGGLIRAALPWTIALVGLATVISFVLGTLLGVAAAWRRGSWLDGVLPAMTFFQAAPYFFVPILVALGTVALMVLGDPTTLLRRGSPADPAERIGRTSRTLDALGGLGEDPVAGGVAVGVGERLEAIELDQGQAQARAVATRALELEKRTTGPGDRVRRDPQDMLDLLLSARDER